jgi:uncharacterized protein
MTMPTTITTASGREFDLLVPAGFTISEIAHALSHICRFSGHSRLHYSVAQHSVMVSYLSGHRHALAGLLHDAHEAYVGDVASPLKALLPDYRALEHRIEAAVRRHFGVAVTTPLEVKHADQIALATEQRDLMARPEGGYWWEHTADVRPSHLMVVPLPAELARKAFMARFAELTRAAVPA